MRGGTRRNIAEHGTARSRGAEWAAVVAVGALEFEPPQIGTEMLGQAIMNTHEDVDMIRHDDIRVYLDRRGISICRNTLYLFGYLLAKRRTINRFSD